MDFAFDGDISRLSMRNRLQLLEQGEVNLRQWRHYRRILFSDYKRAFGEAPGPLVGLALMTDTHNTGASAEVWCGDVVLKG